LYIIAEIICPQICPGSKNIKDHLKMGKEFL
jgi:hypothetical protein